VSQRVGQIWQRVDPRAALHGIALLLAVDHDLVEHLSVEGALIPIADELPHSGRADELAAGIVEHPVPFGELDVGARRRDVPLRAGQVGGGIVERGVGVERTDHEPVVRGAFAGQGGRVACDDRGGDDRLEPQVRDHAVAPRHAEGRRQLAGRLVVDRETVAREVHLPEP